MNAERVGSPSLVLESSGCHIHPALWGMGRKPEEEKCKVRKGSLVEAVLEMRQILHAIPLYYTP